MQTTMLVSISAFHFPICAIGPEKIAPTAEPNVHAVVMIVDHLVTYVLSREYPSGVSVISYQPNNPPNGYYNVLNTPIEYPNWNVPILTVSKNANKNPFFITTLSDGAFFPSFPDVFIFPSVILRVDGFSYVIGVLFSLVSVIYVCELFQLVNLLLLDLINIFSYIK